tara:strand:- start:1046 stop:1414 length:369 start_codon:yes stop_codon:yes gene_type:complete
MSTIKADNIATLAGVSTSMANAVNGSAKAWVNFNGTGTVAIRAAYNVSSITDITTGTYIINFATAMPDVGYVALANTQTAGTNQVTSTIDTNYEMAVGSVRIVTISPSQLIDARAVTVAIFR